MISRILVPLDGSRRAEGALPYAAAIGSAFNADLVLHRVGVTATDGTPTFVAPFESDLIRHQAQKYLTALADRLKGQGQQVSTIVCDGKPIDAMLHAIAESASDLVVVASDRQGPTAPDYLAGGVLQLVSAGVCSALVIRQPTGVGPASNAKQGSVFNRIGALVDGSHRSEWAACLAASISRSQGCHLSLLHVVPAPEMPRRAPLAPDEGALVASVVAANRRAAEGLLADLRARLTAAGAPVDVRIAEATRVAPAIARLASDEGADLLVMSAHGWGCDNGPDQGCWPYGSVCESLLLHGSASMLVLQDLAPVPDWQTKGETASAARPPRRRTAGVGIAMPAGTARPRTADVVASTGPVAPDLAGYTSTSVSDSRPTREQNAAPTTAARRRR